MPFLFPTTRVMAGEGKRRGKEKGLLVLFGNARDKVGREAENLRPSFSFREESVAFSRG